MAIQLYKGRPTNLLYDYIVSALWYARRMLACSTLWGHIDASICRYYGGARMMMVNVWLWHVFMILWVYADRRAGRISIWYDDRYDVMIGV